MREGLRFIIAFPPLSSNADRQQVEWQSECLLSVGERHTSGPLGEGQLFLVKKPETRPIAFFFFFWTLVNFGRWGVKSRPFPTPPSCDHTV